MSRRAADERRTDRSDTPVAARPYYDGGRRTVRCTTQGKGVIHAQSDGGRGTDTVVAVAVAVARVENIGRV